MKISARNPFYQPFVAKHKCTKAQLLAQKMPFSFTNRIGLDSTCAPKGSSINDVTVLGREGEWILWLKYEGLSNKTRDGDGGRGESKIVQNCVTSFMDDP